MLEGNISGAAGVNANAFAMGVPQATGQANLAYGASEGTGTATSASKIKTKTLDSRTFVVQRYNSAGTSTTPAPVPTVEVPIASASVPVNSVPGWLSNLGFKMQTGYGDAGTYTGYINQYMGGSNTSYGDTFSSSSPLGVPSGYANSAALPTAGYSPYTQPINIDVNSIPVGGGGSFGGAGATGSWTAGANPNLKPYDVNGMINAASGVATGNPNLQPIDLKKLLNPEELDEAGKKNPLLKQVQASLAPMGLLKTSTSGGGSTAKQKAYNSIPAYMRDWDYFKGPNGVLASLDHYEENKDKRDAEKAAKMNGGSSSGGGKKKGGLLGGILG